MGYRETYEMWCTDPYFDDKTKEELRNLAGDEKEIEDRFYRQLEFGTGGLRGMIGAGTNRMNIYTVRQATQGLANSGVLSLNTMSFFPMLRQFSTGTTVFSRPYFSLIFFSMAALDTKVRQEAYFAFPCAANIGW